MLSCECSICDSWVSGVSVSVPGEDHISQVVLHICFELRSSVCGLVVAYMVRV